MLKALDEAERGADGGYFGSGSGRPNFRHCMADLKELKARLRKNAPKRKGGRRRPPSSTIGSAQFVPDRSGVQYLNTRALDCSQRASHDSFGAAFGAAQRPPMAHCRRSNP